MYILRNVLQFLPKKPIRNRKKCSSFPNNKWFDSECKHMKRIVNNIGKLLNNPDFSTQYWNQRKVYKSLIRQKSDKLLHSGLYSLRIRNAKEFWKVISKSQNQVYSNSIPIDINQLGSYFGSLHKGPIKQNTILMPSQATRKMKAWINQFLRKS